MAIGTNDHVLTAASGETSGTKWASAVEAMPGLVIRPEFTYSSSTAIQIKSAVYHHEGTTQQAVYWDSQLTFTFGSGGSNAASDNLAASKRFYLFLDDSAIVTKGTALLDNSCFIGKNEDNVTINWDNAKHGWYEATATSDRCIMAVRTNGSSQLFTFWHDGGNRVLYDTPITDANEVDYDTTWTNLSLTAPSFATRIGITARGWSSQDGAYALWRPGGSSSGNGNNLFYHQVDNGSGPIAHLDVFAPSQIIELKHSISDLSTISVYTNSWYFPAGM